MKKLYVNDSKAAAYFANEKFKLFKRPAEMKVCNDIIISSVGLSST